MVKEKMRSDGLIASMSNGVKVYSGIKVVDGVSFNLYSGTTTIIVGPNGSGKTTMLEMLVGLRSMTSGKATILDSSVVPGGTHRLYTGVQLQSSSFPSRIRTKEVIRATQCLYARPADWEPMAEMLGVDMYLDTIVDNLSGGQRRRLDILCAAIGKPALLVLDEPTSGIDSEGRAVIWDFIRCLRSEGSAILATTHNLSEAEMFADVLMVMKEGKISFEGRVKDVIARLGEYKRINIINPSKRIIMLFEESGLSYKLSGMSITAIGNEVKVNQLCELIRDESDVIDVFLDSARLEDVLTVNTGMEM
ncbi:ABC transporter ATP-binding protein [Alloscardovia macacae]|nr:ABC transporter ATP-binding protein [Alloscardovia macacae]